jgi:RNA polymerase sigma-70 factor (ECF subfamily)
MRNQHSFEELIQEYHPIIYKICRVYSSNEDFDDLYQEILINLWRSYQSFEGRSKVSTWLYRVALNTSLTYQRNTKKNKSHTTLQALPELAAEESGVTDKNEQIEQLYLAISQLDKNDRSIMLLYLDEKSYDEIADITGLSQSNVGVKINRIKKKLFQILNQRTDG